MECTTRTRSRRQDTPSSGSAESVSSAAKNLATFSAERGSSSRFCHRDSLHGLFHGMAIISTRDSDADLDRTQPSSRLVRDSPAQNLGRENFGCSIGRGCMNSVTNTRNHEHRQARSIGAAVLRSVNVVWLAPRSEARSPAPHLYGPGYGSNARSIRGLILCTARAAPHAFVNPPIPRQSFRAIDSDMIPY